MNNDFKKTILIDLDGVLNTYTGKFDEKVILPIKEGARVGNALNDRFYKDLCTFPPK